MVRLTSSPVMFQKPTLQRPGATSAACVGMTPPGDRDSVIDGARSGGSLVVGVGACSGAARDCGLGAGEYGGATGVPQHCAGEECQTGASVEDVVQLVRPQNAYTGEFTKASAHSAGRM